MASFLARRWLVIVALFGLIFPYLGCAATPPSTQPTATPGFPSLALPSPTPGGAAPTATSRPAPTPATTPRTPTPAPAVTGTPASAAKQSYGGIITSAVQGDPASYDAHREVSIYTLGMVAPTYDRLIETEPITSKLLPGLAERWETSSDGKTVTFYLRKGVKWHDGRPFTSADAKVTLDKIISPPKGVVSPRKALVGDGVTKVEAPDDFTLKVTLERPRGGFIPAVASAWNVVVPKHIMDAKGDVTKDVIGTGPFKFKEHIRGVSWELVKNPDYWVAGKPYLDSIITYIIPDAANRLAAFRTKRVNLWYNYSPPSPTDATTLTRQFGDQTWVQESGYWGFGGITFNLKRYPWNDVRARTAVDLAVNREEARKIAFKSTGGAHHGIMSPEGPW
ncbi:MAG: ABC transporter substrate-binding protein, partial [Chloroflexota bacterium]|nr:ABC transporter substrate-binding protein [Chloroflexota bacterium]